MWEVALLIVVVVGCVHFVHKTAWGHGHRIGISVGRKEILEENIVRTGVVQFDNQALFTLVEQLSDAEETRRNQRLITHNSEVKHG